MDRSIEQYLEDIAVIKDTLTSQEDQVLLDPWIYFSWSIVISIGTAVSVGMSTLQGWSAAELALRVWLIAILVGGVFESLGWLQVLRRDNRVLLTSRTIKLALSFIGVASSCTYVAFLLVLREVPAAGIILLLLGICFFFLAIFSFKHLFIEAYAAAICGVALSQLPLDPLYAYTAAGVIAALLFLTAGMHTRYLSRKRNA